MKYLNKIKSWIVQRYENGTAYDAFLLSVVFLIVVTLISLFTYYV